MRRQLLPADPITMKARTFWAVCFTRFTQCLSCPCGLHSSLLHMLALGLIKCCPLSFGPFFLPSLCLTQELQWYRFLRHCSTVTHDSVSLPLTHNFVFSSVPIISSQKRKCLILFSKPLQGSLASSACH
jgi:hypothetical protein